MTGNPAPAVEKPVIAPAAQTRSKENMKKRYFIRKFTRFFFIFSFPVIIMGIILSVYSYFQIRKDINLQAKSTFQIGSELMEEIMNKGDDIAVMFNNSTNVSMSLYKILNQTSLNYKEYVAKDLISSSLENTAASFDYIDSIYLYFANDKDMFYQTDKNILSISQASDQAWLDSFKEKPRETQRWIEKRAFQSYSFEPIRDSVSIFRRLNYFDGVLVTNLNISNLSARLSSIENYPNETILVTDDNGRILFSNPNAEALQFDSDRSVMEQLTSYQTGVGSYLSTVGYQGRVYVMTEFDSDDYGLHFLSLVPRRDLYQLLYQIIYCVVMGVIIAAVLCLLFSFYLTNRNFNQIEQLLDIFWKAELGEYPEDEGCSRDRRRLDEYNLILNQVIHTYVRNNTLNMKIRERELKRNLSELKALQLQINPHFFFNTLQSIDMEIIKKEGYEAPASKLIHDLSDILRYALEDSASPVPLREEIKSCREYFEIQDFHNPGQISLLWDYEEEILDCRVIRLLFQPFLENSIRYSISGPEDRCLIRIKILDRGDHLRFHILDNGPGMERDSLLKLRGSLDTEDSQRTHIGVKNTHKRLTLSYPGNPGLRIISFKGQGTCISFSIPKEIF